MATQYQNLSDYDDTSMPPKTVIAQQKYAIATASWNRHITGALLDGAIKTLMKHGVRKEHIHRVEVPGTFELTHAAARLMSQTEHIDGVEKPKYAAIIALGCVVQGETPHFTYVCQGVTQGITQLNLQPGGCPVVFGVLTTNTMQQAEARAGGIHGNKGDEAAITAIKMANIVW